jgi:hypothetical protein
MRLGGCPHCFLLAISASVVESSATSLPFNQIGDIAYHNYPQVVPGSCNCAAGGGGAGYATRVGTMASITWAGSNQNCVPLPGSGQNVVLALFGRQLIDLRRHDRAHEGVGVRRL